MATKNAIFSNDPIEVSKGCTGSSSHTAYSPLFSGSSSTSPLQTSSLGESGIVLLSSGSGAIPNWNILPTYFEVLGSDPGSPTDGQVWFNSSSNTFKCAVGSLAAWSASTAIGTARSFIGSCGTPSDTLICGGFIASSTVFTKVEQFNGSTWTNKADMNYSYLYGTATGTSSSAIVFGGYMNASYNKTEKWNGTSWTAGNNLNNSHFGCLGFGNDSDAIVIGGDTGPSIPAEGSKITERWNGTSWSATTSTNNPQDGTYGGAGTASDGLSGKYDVIERWDGTGSTWTNKASTISYLNESAMSGTADSALMYGAVGNCESYDGVANSWTVESNIGYTDYSNGGAGGSSSSAITIGGKSVAGFSGTPTSNVSIFSGGSATIYTFTTT